MSDSSPAPASESGVAIYVLVDALGWQFMRDGASFLDGLAVDRRELETVLGYSSAAIPSILSGRLPNAHGHWNLFYRSPETSPFRWTKWIGKLPAKLVENRVARKLINEISRWKSGYSGYFSAYGTPVERLHYYDLCETRDIYEPGGLETCPSIFDDFREGGVRYECFNYHSNTDAEIFDEVPRRLASSDSRVYFVYLSELDAYLHFNVQDEAGVREKLDWYDAGLRRIHEAAIQRFGEAAMYVFSDHGMTPVNETVDLQAEIDGLGLELPKDYLPAYDSTMARFWLWNERAESTIRDYLSKHPKGRILDESEIEKLGIAFPDHRYGHLVFLLQPGAIVCPSDMGKVPYRGMHGFHPEEPTASAALVSTVPVPDDVRHITDIYGLMRREAGLDRSPAAA